MTLSGNHKKSPKRYLSCSGGACRICLVQLTPSRPSPLNIILLTPYIPSICSFIDLCSSIIDLCCEFFVFYCYSTGVYRSFIDYHCNFIDAQFDFFVFTCYFIYRIVIVLFVITTSLTSVAVSLIYIAISLIFVAISLTLLMCVTLYRVCSCGLLCYRILIATSWLPLLFLRLLPLSLSHLI